jgi:3-methyladenine DNA glycosylase AlkC
MEPFKNLLNAALVDRMAAHLQRAWPGFDAQAFAAQATAGLDALEMKARAMQLADALEATLPADFDHAARVLESALAPAWPGSRLGSDDPCRDGLEGWALWPAGEFVARRGLGQPARGLQALHALTQRFSAEFAIRPFIATHPALAFDTLQRWTNDPSDHVRRLVSEGSRPRLPWGLQLKALIRDPAPTLPLLRALMDDDSEYVRRSVANHLNDIAKDHPAVVTGWVREHAPGGTGTRLALLRHASRTLVKRGDPAMLDAWGLGSALQGQARLALAPACVRLGESLELDVTLVSHAPGAQKLVIDYAVHHLKADGSLSPKVFKGWNLVLAAGETRRLARRHSMRPVTTRQYRPGRHVLDLRVNGQVLAVAEFALETD